MFILCKSQIKRTRGRSSRARVIPGVRDVGFYTRLETICTYVVVLLDRGAFGNRNREHDQNVCFISVVGIRKFNGGTINFVYCVFISGDGDN